MYSRDSDFPFQEKAFSVSKNLEFRFNLSEKWKFCFTIDFVYMKKNDNSVYIKLETNISRCFCVFVSTFSNFCSEFRVFFLSKIKNLEKKEVFRDFPCENSFSVSSCDFRKFRPFSVIAENHCP